MKVEQAVFSSIRGGKRQGYHLVARSRGIHDQMAGALERWSPSHAALRTKDTAGQSLNFHPVDDQHVACSRTVYGGPEYSGRGGLQIVTRILVFPVRLLRGFDGNPLQLLRTALVLGYLRWSTAATGWLPAISFPETSHLGTPPTPPGDLEDLLPLPELLQMIRLRGRVAVVGPLEPLGVLQEILRRCPAEERVQLSFTTGLKPSVERPFTIHFFDSLDSRLLAQLSALGISQITART